MSRKYEDYNKGWKGDDMRKMMACPRCKSQVFWLVKESGMCVDCTDDGWYQ